MDFWVYGFRFIEIVKGLGANKFWPKRFEQDFFLEPCPGIGRAGAGPALGLIFVEGLGCRI